MTRTQLLTATALVLTLIPFLPGAQAATFTEDFEDDTPGFFPEGDGYTFTAVGTNALVTTAQAHTGTQSFQTKPTVSIDRSTFDFDDSSFDICNPGTSFTFWLRIDTLPTVGNLVGYYIQPTGGSTADFGASNYVGIQIQSAGQIALQIGTGGSFSPIPTLTANTWVDFTIYAVDCTGDEGCLSSATLSINGCGDGPGDTVTGTISAFSVLSNAGYTGTTSWLDDIAADNGGAVGEYVIQWCSDHGSTDFGYDFREDVNRITTDASIEIDPYYRFEGTSGDYGYLAKSFGGTQTLLAQFFRIEAAAEAADSNFRVTWSFVPATGTVDNPILDKGNGDDTGDFAQHLEIRFLETGNDWNIRAFFVDVAGGVTSRTELGQAVPDGNPNSPTAYVAVLDTVAGRVKVFRVDDSAGTPVYVQSQSGGDPVLAQSGNVTDLVLDVDIFAGAGNFANDVIESAWFTGFHTSILPDPGGAPPRLALDEDPDTRYSTCYASSFTIDPNGDSGSLPSTITGGDPDGDNGDITGFFGQVDETLFMGFLLIFGIVWMGIRQGAPGAAIGALFLIGLMLGYAIGWIPLWVLLVLFVISLAAVWFLPKPGSAEGGLSG